MARPKASKPAPKTEEQKVEALAEILHLAGKAAVEAGQTLNRPDVQTFVPWENLPDNAREGRRSQARYLRLNWAAVSDLLV